MPAIRSTRRRYCCANPTARRRRSPTRSAAMRELLEASGATTIAVSQDEAQRLQVLVGPQGGVSGRRPHLARLLLHRRHDTAPLAGAGADAHRRTVARIRPALHERLPRRRRQPASADPLRRQRARRGRQDRGVRREDSRAVHRGRWHDHRRAWRRRREDRPDVHAVRRRRARALPRDQARVRRRRPAQSRQGRADAASLRRDGQDARPRAASCRTPTFLVFERPDAKADDCMEREDHRTARARRRRTAGRREFAANTASAR